MASAESMKAYRQTDTKKLVQIRLHHETLARLDAMVQTQGASGRAEVIEGLLARPEPDDGNPKAWAKEGTHLLRRFFRATGRTEGTARDERGVVDMWVRYEP